MSLPSINQPLGDLSAGYVVQPEDWNSMFDTLYNYLNATVKPAIDALNSVPPPTVAAQGTFQARLTLQTGVPYPTVPQSAKPSMFLTGLRGNLIGIFDIPTTTWINHAFSVDITQASPTGVRDLFDVWVSWNGTALVLSTTPYVNQVCTNNPAAGSAVVCLMAVTTAFAVGDIVSITDGSNQEEAKVTAVSAGVSITLDVLSASYTAPTVRSNTPTVPVAYQDGVPVKSTDRSFRFVATVLVIANALHDTLSIRGVGNYYNRIDRPFYHANTATSFAQTVGLLLSNAVKTVGVSASIFVAPAAQLGTPYTVNRVAGSISGNKAELLEQIDGVLSAQAGYAPSGAAPGNPNIPLNVSGAVLAGGRHTIVDWYNVPSGSATVTNIQDTYQVSYTTGSILN